MREQDPEGRIQFRFDPTSGTLEIRAAAEEDAGWQVCDLDDIERQVIDDFDRKAARAIERLEIRQNWATAIPGEAMEAELASDPLRPFIYSRLVTLKSAETIREVLNSPEVRLLENHLRSGVLSDRVLREAFELPARAWESTVYLLMTAVRLPAAWMTSLVLTAATVLHALWKERGRGTPTAGLDSMLMALYLGEQTHTQHLRKLIRGRHGEAEMGVLALLQMRASLHGRWLEDDERVKVLLPVGVNHLVTAAWDVARVLPTMARLYGQLQSGIGAKATFQTMIATLSRFHRGCMYRRWAAKAPIAWDGKTVVFSLAVGADAVILDLDLQGRGARTVHWLHGRVGSTLRYRGHSSLCVTRTAGDAAAMQKMSTYGQCTHVAQEPARTTRGVVSAASLDSGLLLLTNFMHPDTLHSGGFGARETLRLIDMARTFLDGRSGVELIWRPHPREREAGHHFEAVASYWRSMGGRVSAIDNTLDDDLGLASFAIATPSTVVDDAAIRGLVPAVFLGTPPPAPALIDSLPDAITFRDAGGLNQVFALLSDPSRYAHSLLRLRTNLGILQESRNGIEVL